VIKPTDPTKDGYIFNYWSTDVDGNNEYDFNTPVKSDLILYAQWAEVCTVTFTNGYCYRGTSSASNRRAICTFTTIGSINIAC